MEEMTRLKPLERLPLIVSTLALYRIPSKRLPLHPNASHVQTSQQNICSVQIKHLPTIATPLNADAAPSLDGGAAMAILSTVSTPVGLMVFPTLPRVIHHVASVTILMI